MPSNCDFSSQLNEIRDLIADIGTSDTSGLESQLAALENRISGIESATSQLTGELPIIQANALAGINTGQAAMNAIAGLSAAMAAYNVALAAQEALAKRAQAQALQALGVGGQAINMAGNAQSAANRALNIANSAMNAAGSALGQARDALGKAASNAGKIAGLIGKVAGIAAAIAGLAGLGLAIANRNAISGLQDSVGNLSGRVSQNESGIKKLQGLVNALIQQFKQLGEFITKEIQRLEALIDGMLGNISSTINSLGGQVSINTNNITQLLQSVGTGTGENLGNIRSRINSLDNQVRDLGASIGGSLGRIGGLQGQISDLRTGLGTASSTAVRADRQSRLNAQQIAGILGTLAALGVAVAALSARKIMCRYNDAQVGAAVKAATAAATATTAMQLILERTLVPFAQATTQTLSTLTKGVDAVKNGVTDGFKWLSIDRVLNIANFIGIMHNAAFLSRDIVESMFDIADVVLQIMGKELKDSQGDDISVAELISGKFERAIIQAIGVDAYSDLRVRWHRFSTIYVSAANVFGSLRSISDSIISGVEVAASYSAKIGNSMMRFGLLPEKVFPWMNEAPNFDNKLITKLEQAEEIASSLSSVTSEVLSISEESKEIANNSVELKARLASKNPEDGTDWSVESGVEAEKQEIIERATDFKSVSLDDINP